MISPAPDNLSRIELGGVDFYTTADPSIFLLDEVEQNPVWGMNDTIRLGHILKPSGIDAPGARTDQIARYALDPFTDEGPTWKTQDITVREGRHGLVITSDSLGSSPGRIGNHAALQCLGWEIDDAQTTAIPTPTTVAATMKSHGVDVQIFPEDGLIGDRDYLQAFIEGKYPVGAGSQEDYLHDIGPAHVPAVLLGGALLRDSLAAVARKLDAADEGEQDKGIRNLDTYTGELSAYFLFNVPLYKIAEHTAGNVPGFPSVEQTERIMDEIRARLAALET